MLRFLFMIGVMLATIIACGLLGVHERAVYWIAPLLTGFLVFHTKGKGKG